MNKLTIYIAMATLCLFFKAEAQTVNTLKDSIKPLKIGDQIPEALWNMPLKVVNHPEGKETVRLSDYRGKLIILDFWATWCGSCINEFPKIDLLQKRNKNLQIILVNSIKGTGDDETKIKAFFTKWSLNHQKSLVVPSVITDIILKSVFPHSLIPHYVWISADGEVKAITSSAYLTNKNIKQFINKAALSPTKKEDEI